MSGTVSWRENLQEMPSELRSLTQLCFAFSLFALLAFGPIGSIDGHAVTRAEFWHAGGGPLFVAIGLLFPVIGYGFTRRAAWSRPAFVAVALALSVMPFFLHRVSLMSVLTTAPFLIPAICLYSSFRVRAYFERDATRNI